MLLLMIDDDDDDATECDFLKYFNICPQPIKVMLFCYVIVMLMLFCIHAVKYRFMAFGNLHGGYILETTSY